MRTRITYEGDVGEGAKWAAWAQRQMDALPAPDERPSARVLSPVDGVTVHLLSGPGGQRIRIVAGQSADTPFELVANGYNSHQLAQYGITANVSNTAPQFLTISDVTIDGVTPYYVLRIAKKGALASVELERFETKAEAIEVSNATPTSRTIAPATVDKYLLRAIGQKTVEVVSALLNNGTIATNEWAEHKLAVARLDGVLQFKQFNPPDESHVMYVRYQEVLSALRKNGFVEVPSDKFILEKQSYSAAAMESLFIALGITSAELEDPIFGNFYQRIELDGGNLLSGIAGVRIRHEATGVFPTPNRELIDAFTVKYDPVAQELVKLSNYAIRDTISASLVSSVSAPTGFVAFDQTFTERIYYSTMDEVKSNSFASLRLLGVDNGTFTLTQTIVVDGDASRANDKVCRWVAGAQTFDVYADGVVKYQGAPAFTFSALSPAAPLVPSFQWSAEPTEIECDLLAFDTNGISNFTTKTWYLLDKPVFSRRSFTGPTATMTRTSAVFERLNGFVATTAMTWPYMSTAADGIAIFGASGAAFNAAVQAYLQAKLGGGVSSEELAALLSAARQFVGVTFNNFLGDEALVLLSKAASGREVVIL